MAYKKGMAFLYIPLFLRGGWLKQNSGKVYGGGLQEQYGTCKSTVHVHSYIFNLIGKFGKHTVLVHVEIRLR